MHLYVVAKGIKPHLETWQNELLAQKVPLMKDGKHHIEDGERLWTQISVRPVQLFEIGFPKEHLNFVMANVGTSEYITKRYKVLKTFIGKIKKFLGLKPVPIPEQVNPLMAPNLQNKSVAVIPIGIKEDIMGVDGVEQI